MTPWRLSLGSIKKNTMKTTDTTTPAPSYWGSPEADAAAERICDRREIAAATIHGHLYRLLDGEWLRPATESEAQESATARRGGINHSGAILVDGISCYIAQ